MLFERFLRGAQKLLPLVRPPFSSPLVWLAFGQTITGDITGTRRRPTGAVVSQANVTAVNWTQE